MVVVRRHPSRVVLSWLNLVGSCVTAEGTLGRSTALSEPRAESGRLLRIWRVHHYKQEC